MTRPTASFYAQWRARSDATLTLRDDSAAPPERLLQAIWQHQRLRRDLLQTLDGKTVRVLHPGFGNAEGGPDFRNAVIQVGDAAPRTGDVEVDLVSAGWRAHGHDKNPAFQNVILHVVWEGPSGRSRRREEENASSGANPPPHVGGYEGPTVTLAGVLDASLSELGQWLECEPVKLLPENFRGKCSAPLRELSSAAMAELLRQAALVRLQGKAAQFSARARHVGWEQSLWEGLFRALGYKHNVWPMQTIAEHRARWSDAPSLLVLQARLLGVSGLLPAEPARRKSEGDDYLRRVWDCWWRERDGLADCTLPQKVWRLHGIRPANHPQRRLALAAHWLFGGTLPAQLEQWSVAAVPEKKIAASLQKIFSVKRDDYWSWHYTLRSPRLKKSQPLLGGTRVTDLAVNVVLPWLWTRAAAGRNGAFQGEIERRYFAWPAAEDNTVLRLARQRLLNGAGRNGFRSAALQQGLMQIVRDFCNHSNAVCDDCPFPELVKNWGVEAGG